MSTQFGVCDWCKKHAPVQPLRYIDGKTNVACKDCYETAKMDVRLYNSEVPKPVHLVAKNPQTHQHTA